MTIKISNSKKVKQKMYFILFILILNISGIFFSLLMKPIYILDIKIYYLFIIISLLFFYLFIKLKCFSYENSGQVITIKIYHPIKIGGIIIPIIEFPTFYLNNFKIKNKILKRDLQLQIINDKGTIYTRTFIVKYLDNQQLKRLTNSLNRTIENNHS